MYITIGKLLELTTGKYPNQEAIVEPQKNIRWTYTEWNEQVNKLAHALQKSGIQKGDRVSTFLFNSSELATTCFACAKIGAVFNPINFRLKPQELIYILEDASPKIVLFEKQLSSQVQSIHKQFPHIQFWYIDQNRPSFSISYEEKLSNALPKFEAVEVKEDDICSIMYTSGTTGYPKGVLHRHREIIDHSLMGIAYLHYNENSRGLVTAPMFHCAELHCCFVPRVHSGGTNIILHHFDAKNVLETIEKEKITVMFAAPTMWNMMLQEDLIQYDLSSLRYGLYGAASMAPALVKACDEKLNVSLVQAYGMTEMGPAITFLRENEQITKVGSAGKAAYNHEIRVVRPNEEGPSEPDDILPPYEIGEIIVRGSCLMKGYYNNEEATAKALYKGWYHSGDLGYVDTDGYLYVADRVDDMVVSGGENIYPREVEDFLYTHESILDVAVLGEKDELWGESVLAYIVSKDQSLTEEILDEYCKSSDKLADYKRPRRYIFVEQLPRNASGKIQKFILRSQVTEVESKERI
ncbi:long-chain fatty acid--CoA ligase [Bacillus cereus]|uniref:fatty acid--CoA ligase n=1 Tax=unclassified Bacillus (in: firmicutes) TaxID=185979 RepID=UPI00047C87AE|nr:MULTISPECIES: fatty acid--CoA ligase [unclassified Bacillus (in: firmicutes)]PFE03569.1 long-chain fatty acid--CoA ligase [Bacillus sp. AFS023182]PGX99370.1 long-chain fatty acid--CoA ligase [Bacillus cereus]